MYFHYLYCQFVKFYFLHTAGEIALSSASAWNCFRNRLFCCKDGWNSQYLFCAQFLGSIFQLISEECYHLFWEHCKRSQWTLYYHLAFLWPAYEPKTDWRLKNCIVNVKANMLNSLNIRLSTSGVWNHIFCEKWKENFCTSECWMASLV